MNQIEYVLDPQDYVGVRCNNKNKFDMSCHRRAGHSTNTTVKKKLDNDTEVEVVFNHRGVMGGKYFTW